ncbi:interferon gamma receptor 2 [Phyllostomus discolor]|uniref:Interferon gamma receptor 2 n=1 Tax=Phyllostomus discolor TaxID=89673 RepID=A0A7E6D1K3_9CHIR|nr:interferon gamma receptor 2 [Phyllostomus discolor]KAF6119076.1 interferon gamma receptor 2 [Phyllostomus discolor]
MRPPPPPLWLLLRLLLLHLGAAAPTPDSPSQLPAPQNPKIHLYNAEQVLSWEPVSLSGDEGPVVYRVQFRYATSSDWFDLTPRQSRKVICSRIAATECNFAPADFQTSHNISLRVRAELPERASAWAAAPWFQRYLNVTVGPPENIRVTPGPGSLTLSFSPPFDVESTTTHFSYCVRYWTLENPGHPQDNGCLRNPLIELKDLKPLRVYCLQVRATLVWNSGKMSTEGLFSNVSCHETAADASTKLQEVVLIAMGTFLSLTALAGACVFLTLRYRGLIKHWLHSPPGVPVQIGEYLRDPEDPVLEAMDRDGAPKEDAWDSVSVLSAPEEQKMLPSTRHQGPGGPQPAGADLEL